jgi:hypothetical protein
MIDGSGRRSSEPFASLGPDGWSLRTHPLCWDLTTGEPSAESSPRWPKQGMTLRGDAYELATWEHRTDESGCSWLLPTPNVPNGGRTMSREDVEAKGSTPRGKRQVDLGSVVKYLPTPTVGDAKSAQVVPRLLPTPRANSGTGANKHGDGGADLQTTMDSLWRQACSAGESPNKALS